MTVLISPVAGAAWQLSNNSGVPLSGGKIYTYAAGTTTPQTTYTTSAGNVAHSNPIVLDSAGRVPAGGEVWVTQSVNYKFVIKDANDTLISTNDNLYGIADTSQFIGPTGSNLIGFIQGGANAVAETAQSKMRQTVNVLDFGADPTGATVTTTQIQNAIDYVYSIGGGVVYFPAGIFNLGTVGLNLITSITLQGSGAYYNGSGAGTIGTVLKYSGSNAALLGQNILNVNIYDLMVYDNGVTGTTAKGIWLNGFWKCTLRNVSIYGFGRTKGWGILGDTNNGFWGAQHNYFEMIETSSSIFRMAGTSGSDAVTTSVCNTNRGYMYEFTNCEFVIINCTVEANEPTQYGYRHFGYCQNVMIGCDIEGNWLAGVRIESPAKVRQVATNWDGFSGTTQFSGDFTIDFSYGAGYTISSDPASGTYFPSLNFSQNPGGGLGNLTAYRSKMDDAAGGNQSAHPEITAMRNTVPFIAWEMKNGFRIEKSVSLPVGSTTVLTINLGSTMGGQIKVVASGSQASSPTFTVYKDAIFTNDFGTVNVTSGASYSTASAGVSMSITASTTTVVIALTATTFAADANLVITYDGTYSTYS